jgi:hypothetical protein
MSKTSEPTANVPSERVAELRDIVAKLNRKAEKLGCPVIVMTLGEPFTSNLDDGRLVEDTPVFIDGEAPKLNGWSFVATLEHDESGTIIRRIPTFEGEIDLTDYRTATPDNCDQCHARRRRNDTYIVAHAKVPEGYMTKQVGSSCLKDFIGHENPEAIARYMEQVRDLIENLQGGSYDGGYVTPRYATGNFMDVAAHVISQTGYISRRQAEENYEEASADSISQAFFQRQTDLDPEPLKGGDKGEKAIAWVRSLEDKDLENDYLYNLYTILKSDSITARQFGIAGSAIVAYDRQMERNLERVGSPPMDEFVGEKGDKIDVEFTVFRIYENVTDYGISYKHILRATTGHTFTWSTASDPLEQGKHYTGTFTIKDHRETKYGKQTRIFRPRKNTLQEVS